MQTHLGYSPFPPLKANIRYRTAMERAGFDVAYLQRRQDNGSDDAQKHARRSVSTPKNSLGSSSTDASLIASNLSESKFPKRSTSVSLTAKDDSESTDQRATTIVCANGKDGGQKDNSGNEYSDTRSNLTFNFEDPSALPFLSSRQCEAGESNTSSAYNTPHMGEPESKFSDMDPVEQSFMQLTDHTMESVDFNADVKDISLSEETRSSEKRLSTFTNNLKVNSYSNSTSNRVSVSLEASASLTDLLKHDFSEDSEYCMKASNDDVSLTKQGRETRSSIQSIKEPNDFKELKLHSEIPTAQWSDSKVSTEHEVQERDGSIALNNDFNENFSTPPLEFAPRNSNHREVPSILAVSEPLKHMEFLDKTVTPNRGKGTSQLYGVTPDIPGQSVSPFTSRNSDNATNAGIPLPVIEISEETQGVNSDVKNTRAVEQLIAELDTFSLKREANHPDNVILNGVNASFKSDRAKKSSAYLSRYETQSLVLPNPSSAEESTLMSPQSNSTPTFYKFAENADIAHNLQGNSTEYWEYNKPCHPLQTPSSGDEKEINTERFSSEKVPETIKYPAGEGPCRSCGLEVTGKSVYSKRENELSGQWHRACFKCTDCDKKFSRKIPCYILNDRPYCQQHYHVQNNSICPICDFYIEGECRENDKHERFHVNCLKCYVCDEAIQQDYYVFGKDVHVCNRHDINELSFLTSNSSSNLNNSTTISKRRTRLINFS